MASSIDGEFTCGACGKRFAWRPDWAGRAAQCTCGHMIDVPKRAPDIDDLYDFALPASDKPLPVQRQTTVAPLAPQRAPDAARPTLAYRSNRQEATDRQKLDTAMTQPTRDRYVPLGLLIVGVLMYGAFVFRLAPAGALAVAIVSLIVAAVVLLKTIALVGVAFGAASVFGAYFGTFWTAVLKLAAILVFTTFGFLWLDEWISSVGGTGNGRSGLRVLGLMFVLEAGVIGILAYNLFDIDTDDVFKIGALMAVGSRLVDIVIAIVLRS